tara:strand:+ start:4962 stop:5504 length:543 start_codon:yes stop_codon:yes gene_type:complete
MRTLKLSFIMLVMAVLAISCSEEHGHEHHGGVSKLLWKDIPCESFTFIQFLGKGKMGDGETAWEVNSVDEIKKQMGTLCNAVVERQFSVGCGRLEEFGFKSSSSYLKIMAREHRVKLYFGRNTPDQFGQYVFLVVKGSDLKSKHEFFNFDETCVDPPSLLGEELKILVIPAYHHRGLVER